MSASTRDSFDLYRARVTRHQGRRVFVTLPSVAGPSVEVGVSYKYAPPRAGTFVWLAATHSFDKFFIIEDPVSVLASLVARLSANGVDYVRVSDLSTAVNQLRGEQ